MTVYQDLVVARHLSMGRGMALLAGLSRQTGWKLALKGLVVHRFSLRFCFASTCLEPASCGVGFAAGLPLRAPRSSGLGCTWCFPSCLRPPLPFKGWSALQSSPAFTYGRAVAFEKKSAWFKMEAMRCLRKSQYELQSSGYRTMSCASFIQVHPYV